MQSLKTPFGLLLVLTLLVAALAAPAHAQDGDLSEEETARLERAIAALQGIEDYQSFTLYTRSAYESHLSGRIEGQAADEAAYQTVVLRSTLVRVDDAPNIRTRALVDYREEPAGPAYRYSARLRRVDDTLYALAEVKEDTHQALRLPAGWFVLEENSEAWYSLVDLNPSDYRGDSTPFDLGVHWAVLQQVAHITRIASGPDELADGTPVEVIEIIFAGQDAAAFFAGTQADNPLSDLISERVSAASHLSFTLALDENEHVRHYRLDVALEIGEIDLHEVDESMPAGVTVFESRVVFLLESDFSAVNADLAPVAAPE